MKGGRGIVFRGYSRSFSTKNDMQYQTIGGFWDEMSAIYGMESLRGLGYGWTSDTIEYAIGLKSNGDMQYGGKDGSSRWMEIELPDTGWKRYKGRTDELGSMYAEIYRDGALSYEIEEFNDDGSCAVTVTRD